ncbi:Homeodomain-like protein [Podospora fimiseda]|uniref:Homeodomain-like protein n=1 Tax=Podospora fimiseda TaxID=252190 RepID=A0AAN7BKZ0_9PEZI|nr:Homeodomain-like protein [Podospora fimiseda]
MVDEERKRSHRGRKRWSEEEDAILRDEAIKQSSSGAVRDWNKIATKLPGRTNKDCRKRWVNKVCGNLKKGLWDREEDQRLQAAVEKYGLKWPQVAAEVGFRSPDQCAKRWQYGLDPRLKHDEWTDDEDNLLLSLVQERGRQWKIIQQKHYPTRSRIDLKNRYTILMRRLNNTSGGDQDSTCPDDETSETSSLISGSGANSEDGMGTRSSYEHDPHHTHFTNDMMQGTHSTDWTTCFSPLTASSLEQSPMHTLTHHHHLQLPQDDGITPTGGNQLLVGSLDHFLPLDTNATPMNMNVTGASSIPNDMLTSPWDDALLASTANYGFQGLIPTSDFMTTTTTAAAEIPNVGATGVAISNPKAMEIPFDPELMNPSMVVSHFTDAGGEMINAQPADAEASSSSVSGSGSGKSALDPGSSSSSREEGTQDGTGEDGEGEDEERDVGKVVIAVEGCDQDTLDYLFSMTRPIKQKVKMEITM